MRTYKPMSTISYNSRPFLIAVLGALQEQKVIKGWVIAYHLGDPKKGTKDHYHVYVDPCTTIDTDSADWKDRFRELQNEGDPLDVMTWTKSKFADWGLYSMHNTDYLTAKKEMNKIEYDLPRERFVASEDWIIDDIFALDTFEYITPIERIIWCFEHKLSKFDAMKKCRVAYSSMIAFGKIYDELMQQQSDTLEERYTMKFYADPEKAGLTEHVYYRDNHTGRLLTTEEYSALRKETL